MATRSGVPDRFGAWEVGLEEWPTERQGEFLCGSGVERGRPRERECSAFKTGSFKATVVGPAIPPFRNGRAGSPRRCPSRWDLWHAGHLFAI